MGSKIYVGNLSYSANENSLTDLFGRFGTVVKASVVSDRETGRSKGFGFVEMSSDPEAQKAIAELNGQEVDGRSLNVSEARPMAPRDGGNGGRSGGGKFSGGGRNRY